MPTIGASGEGDLINSLAQNGGRLLSEWNESHYPKSSEYFSDFCRQKIGTVDFNVYIQTVTNLPVPRFHKEKRFLDLPLDDPPIEYDPLTNEPIYFGDGIEISCLLIR